jgi:hypothetical protein
MFHFLRGISCFPPRVPWARGIQVAICLSVMLSSSWAKDVPVTGVLLYLVGTGYGYVQVTGLLINGKTELRACSTDPIDKSVYRNLNKFTLATVKTLERMPDGKLMAAFGDAAPVCVLPGNFKFDKDKSLSASELVDKSAFAGQVMGAAPGGVTAFPGFAVRAKFVAGSPSDNEMAGYLLAERSRTILAWQAYLDKYTKGSHVPQARAALVDLLVQDGSQKLASYMKSSGLASPAYVDLKDAHDRAYQAQALIPDNAAAAKLRDAVAVPMKDICDKATAKLQAFTAAMAAHTRGFDQLLGAKDLSDQVSGIDSRYPPAIALRNNVEKELKELETALQTANSERASQQFDDAYVAITKYVSFSEEEPRVRGIIVDAYNFHVKKADNEALAGNLDGTVADLRRAVELDPTDEAKLALAKAEAGLLASQNRLAADHALIRSKAYMDDENAIDAYEVLASLNDAQRLLVKSDMAALVPSYVIATTQKAQELKTAHVPMHGRADEASARLAYDYLQRASKLSDDAEIANDLELLATEISNYYVELGEKYLSRPLSSGVGLGWAYLTEAQQYRPNLDTIRDDRTRNNAAYQMRSKLTIGVLFRDQTSRRDNEGFADQLQQAFATGLETSGLPVKVILPGGSGALEPNFQFVGEILEHRPIRNPKKETLQSEYGSGSREIPNEAWNRADQAFESVNLELQKAQTALAAAQTKDKKKLIDQAKKTLDDTQVLVQEARLKMNSIPKTITEKIVSQYNYTRTTLELTNVVRLSFRILDFNGTVIGQPTDVVKNDPRKFTILEGVKAEDTKGVKEIDSAPDEQQLMMDVEIAARDTIVTDARERVRELPERVLAEARRKAAGNDLEGAGELYVLYLNCTFAGETEKRTEAAHFLSSNFNLRHAGELSAGVQ